MSGISFFDKANSYIHNITNKNISSTTAEKLLNKIELVKVSNNIVQKEIFNALMRKANTTKNAQLAYKIKIKIDGNPAVKNIYNITNNNFDKNSDRPLSGTSEFGLQHDMSLTNHNIDNKVDLSKKNKIVNFFHKNKVNTKSIKKSENTKLSNTNPIINIKKMNIENSFLVNNENIQLKPFKPYSMNESYESIFNQHRFHLSDSKPLTYEKAVKELNKYCKLYGMEKMTQKEIAVFLLSRDSNVTGIDCFNVIYKKAKENNLNI